MTIFEILELESSNTGVINMFKEGFFWRIYQKSAYFFVKNIKELKVITKNYKSINSKVVYAGFPATLLPKIEILIQSKGLLINRCSEKRIIISGFVVDDAYNDWFHKNVMCQNATDFRDIEKKILSYPLLYKSPIEAVEFLAELQETLKRNSK